MTWPTLTDPNPLPFGTLTLDRLRNEQVETYAALVALETSADDLQAQITALSIGGAYLGPVANQTAMLLLSPVNAGDYCLRLDIPSFYVWDGNNPTLAGSWDAANAAGAVVSVDGQTGVVDLSASYASPSSVTTAIGTAITTHEGDTDPHGDRAFATAAIATHATPASDSHGDRAYARGLLTGKRVDLSDPAYGATSVLDGSGDCWSAIQGTIDSEYTPGVEYYFGNVPGQDLTVYDTLKPFIIPAGATCTFTWPAPAKVASNPDKGVFCRVRSGSSATDWKKMGMFTPYEYRYGTGSSSGADNPVVFNYPCIDGNRKGVMGAGIILWNKQSVIWEPRILRVTGTSATSHVTWDYTSGGDGRGYGVALVGKHYDNTTSTVNDANDIRLYGGFIETAGPAFATLDSGAPNPMFPDGQIIGTNFMKVQNSLDYLFDVPRVSFLTGSDWWLDGLHFNNHPGELIQISNCWLMRITNCFFDGWGYPFGASGALGYRGTPTYAINIVNLSDNENTQSTMISDSIFRTHKELSSSAQVGLVHARTVQTAGDPMDVYLNMSNLVHQWENPFGTGGSGSQPVFGAFDLVGDTGSTRNLYVGMSNVRLGGYTKDDGTKRPVADNEIFMNSFTSGDGTLTFVDWDDSCSWVSNGPAGRRTAVPTNGNWPLGGEVRFPGAASGAAPRARCVTAGAPGTWKNYGNLA